MKLSRRSFSRRIQEWTLGKHTDYASNLCNHFWLTMFCISCWTIFLPITLIIIGISAIVDWNGRRKQRRKENLLKQGAKLTVEQAFQLMLDLGWAHYTGNDIHYEQSELACARRDSKRKKEVLLVGWRNAQPSNAVAYDQIANYVEKLVSEYRRGLSVKKVAASVRTTMASYVPTTFWTLMLGAAVLAGALVGGYVYADQGGGWSGWLLGILALIGVFVIGLLPALFLWVGGDGGNADGPVGKLAYKYGKPLEDDIFISYLKAVKKKMCPIIEWVD